ncbi:cupin domain-containing protein [Marinilactibacillus piezotolerans]|uniref:cupin domain-containing protein n=1 Tax=Marinilactibacillus piezotolerans TaxID=258723 RepID=UPI0009B0259C|nr:cupin domain-containing protein [Marinilactibacillus piezotolerans]
MKTARQWITELNLQPHPEGGFFVQTDVSSQTYSKTEKDFPLYTNIYFLLTEDSPSHFHQLTSDELWFFHDGNPLTVHSLHGDGSYSQTKLGLSRVNEEQLHHNVPAGTIFGSTVEEGYALVSCTVIPGFDFSDFKLFTQAELLETYSDHHKIISKLAYETLSE